MNVKKINKRDIGQRRMGFRCSEIYAMFSNQSVRQITSSKKSCIILYYTNGLFAVLKSVLRLDLDGRPSKRIDTHRWGNRKSYCFIEKNKNNKIAKLFKLSRRTSIARLHRVFNAFIYIRLYRLFTGWLLLLLFFFFYKYLSNLIVCPARVGITFCVRLQRSAHCYCMTSYFIIIIIIIR
jgi:hypothetical protein